MLFFLGCHRPAWLATRGVPLFVSREKLKGRKTFPRAVAPWALDSGGFTQIKDHGRWTISVAQYIADVREYRDKIGGMMWAAPMDWMCEPPMVIKSGKTVLEHQKLTVANFVELRHKAGDVPFVPVIQGFTRDEYFRCVEMYRDAGVNLAQQPLVGLGSVCRRQATDFVASLVEALFLRRIKLHAFGLKIAGLKKCARWLVSADSMAWSKAGTFQKVCPKNPTLASCANCWHFARAWHGGVVRAIAKGNSRVGSGKTRRLRSVC